MFLKPLSLSALSTEALDFQILPLFSYVLISCKKTRKSGSRVLDPFENAQSSFRTKKTMWKVAAAFRKKNEMFSKKFFTSSKGNPFSTFSLKIQTIRSKIVRLIAKERLPGPLSSINNVELKFEGSG